MLLFNNCKNSINELVFPILCVTLIAVHKKCEHGELPDEYVLHLFNRRDEGFSGIVEGYFEAQSTAEHEVLCSLPVNRAKTTGKMRNFFFSYNEDLLKAEHSQEISE